MLVRALPIYVLALTALPAAFEGADASAAEGTIAFSRNALVENKGEGRRYREVQTVWLMNGDGSRLRRLRPRLVGGPSWIAGGRRIATGQRPRNRRINFLTVSRSGRDRQRLLIDLPHSPRTGESAVTGTAFAPDGRRIAFAYYEETADTTSIWLHSASGDKQLPLGEAIYLAAPSWSPDGGLIAAVGSFAAVPSQPFNRSVGVFLLDPAGGDPRLLASWPQVDNTGPTGVSWSPDGRTLAVPYVVENPGGPTITDNYAQLLLIDVASGRIRGLRRDPEPSTSYYSVAWSPDGRRIGFSRSQGVNVIRSDIWVIDQNSGRAKNLTRTPQQPGSRERLLVVARQQPHRPVLCVRFLRQAKRHLHADSQPQVEAPHPRLRLLAVVGGPVNLTPQSLTLGRLATAPSDEGD
jgi:dipeptidyl aminopeptidase/acylaminoacyl peptidase